MDKKKIFKTIINLISLGAIAKFLSTIAKIMAIRLVSPQAMGIFALSSSSFILVITLVQLGLPSTITKIVARSQEKRKKVIATAIIVITINGVILSLLILLAGPYFARNIIKNPDILPSIYALIPLIPLIGYGSIIKAYYIGINKVEYPSIAQITEEVARIFFLGLFAKKFSDVSPAYGSVGIIVGMIFGEIASIINLLIFSRKKLKNHFRAIKKSIVQENDYLINELLPPSLSLTAGRIIGALTYFVEPIILSNLLLKENFEAEYISIEYGLLSNLAMPLLLLPGFFSIAFSNALLPTIAKAYQEKKIAHAKKTSHYLIFSSFLIGLIFSLGCFIFPSELMKLLYNTTSGASYVRFIALPFIIYYIQAPLTTILLAVNKEKKGLIDTLVGSIVRIILLVTLIPKYHFYGVAIATIASVFIVTFLHALTCIRTLGKE